LGQQLGLQLEQIIFQAMLKGSHVSLAPFAFAGFAVSQQQVIPGA
jgi:hypothetical protein